MYCTNCGAKIAMEEDADPVLQEQSVFRENPTTQVRPDGNYDLPDPMRQHQTPEKQSDYVKPKQPRKPRSKRTEAPKPKKMVYQKTSVGFRILSIILCVLTFLFGLYAMVIGTCRIALTENNIRSAYRDGQLADLVISTCAGSKTLTDIILEGAVDAKTKESIPLEREWVRSFLSRTSVSNYVEDSLVDLPRCILFGDPISTLNADSISNFLSMISYDLRHEIGYYLPNAEIESIKADISNGKMGLLSAGSVLDLGLLSSFFSVGALIISSVLALLCLVLVLVINRRNLPFGLGMSGKTLMILGSLNLVLCLSTLLITLVKKSFLYSDIFRYFAYGMGVLSIAVLTISVILVLICGLLKRNSETVSSNTTTDTNYK